MMDDVEIDELTDFELERANGVMAQLQGMEIGRARYLLEWCYAALEHQVIGRVEP